jgi:hypothetical protein
LTDGIPASDTALPGQTIAVFLLLLLPAHWRFLDPAGGVQYVPVDPSSRIFAAAASWRLPSFVVCLASSYLQRVVARDATLAKAAAACSGFEMHHYSLPQKVRQRYIPSHYITSHYNKSHYIILHHAP